MTGLEERPRTLRVQTSESRTISLTVLPWNDAGQTCRAVRYFGKCQGISIDIDAAIVNAREAAQAGYTSAILRIGPHLPAGQMDPNEVTAWGLGPQIMTNLGCGS
jgi:hypothetical protein